jgi:hypothetical protein
VSGEVIRNRFNRRPETTAMVDEALADIHYSNACDDGLHRYCVNNAVCDFHEGCAIRCQCSCHPAPVTGRDIERRFGRGDTK